MRKATAIAGIILSLLAIEVVRRGFNVAECYYGSSRHGYLLVTDAGRVWDACVQKHLCFPFGC